MESQVSAVRDYLQNNRDRHLKRLQTLLRQPSVSVDGEGTEACSYLFADLCKDAGFPEVEVVKTPGVPGVWAAYDVGAPVTMVIYSMLDVRRADPEGWKVPPFSAEIVEHANFPAVVMARGARAVKGPTGVFLNAVEACKNALGKPPVNILMIAEGDEILGSPGYPMMIERYRERIANGTAGWTPGCSQDAQGNASLTLGYKGLIYMALRASGEKWGRGPRGAPAHGMAKSVLDSVAWRLVQALATLTGPDGNTVLIPGFDKPVALPPAGEAAEIAELRRKFAGKPWQSVLSAVGGQSIPSVGDMTEEEIYHQYFYGPSVNLNGLKSGYIGPGSLAFTMPQVAEAVLDIRIPRDWKCDDILRGMRSCLDEKGFTDVEMDVFAANDGSRVSRESTLVRAAASMFADKGVDVTYWPMTGGGGPWSMFSTEFGMPLLRDVGMGHGGSGAKNEYLVVEGTGKVEGVVGMAASHVEYMLRMAQMGAQK